MKSIKSILSIGLILTMTSGAIFAQGSFNEPLSKLSVADRTTHLTKGMNKQLNLSPSQMSKVEAINATYANKLDRAMRNANDNHQIVVATWSLRSERNEALEAVLTPAQLTNYERTSAKRSSRMGKSIK